MHSVLWGTSQSTGLQTYGRAGSFQCTPCFGVLLNEEKRKKQTRDPTFQCTPCFGVLLNVSNPMTVAVLVVFQCTPCFGVSRASLIPQGRSKLIPHLFPAGSVL